MIDWFVVLLVLAALALIFARRRLLRKLPPFLGETVRVVDMSDTITVLDPDTSQFSTMMMRLPRGKDEKVLWLDEPVYPRIDLYDPANWRVDMSAHPVERVAREAERVRLTTWNALQVQHPDLWHDGRWVE